MLCHDGSSFAKLAMHHREHVVLLRPSRLGLLLHARAPGFFTAERFVPRWGKPLRYVRIMERERLVKYCG